MLLRIFSSLALISLASASVSMHNPFYCFATDPIHPQNQMFSILTAYEAVRGSEIPNVSSCTPRKFWMFSRHGTRIPTLTEMTGMANIQERLHSGVLKSYGQGRAQLCRSDYQNIADWVFNTTVMNPDRALELVEAGWAELRGIAERMQAAFPNILPTVYNRSLFLFQHTDTQRTEASLHAFAQGLFGGENYRDIVFEPVPEVDRMLRPYEHCPIYDLVRTNLVEQNAFVEGPEYQQMLEQVNRKLGFFGSNQLSSQEIHAVWDFCKFYQGFDPSGPSPWCAAFSVANHAVLEYFEDLNYYYGAGYGGQERLFSNLNCYMMQDLLQFITSDDPNDHLVRVYNTHTRALQLFLVTLGVFRNDAHPTRHNFAQQTFRRWRSSVVAPMATNFIFVQHECSDGDNDLVILFNEHPLHIPGCEGSGFCKQSTFLRIFERFLNANCGELFCSHD